MPEDGFSREVACRGWRRHRCQRVQPGGGDETTTALGFQLGEAHVKLTRARDNERIAMRERKSDGQEKKNRERRRLLRIRQQDMLTEAEGGPSYASGELYGLVKKQTALFRAIHSWRRVCYTIIFVLHSLHIIGISQMNSQ